MDKKYIGIIVLVLIVAGGSFYGGMAYANGQRATARAGFTAGAGGRFAGGAGGTRTGGGATIGSIIAKDSTSITVKSASGSTTIVLLGTTTQVMKTAAGSLDDLSVGTNVLVTGTANSDGSVSATTVSIRPAPTTPPAQTTSGTPAQ